MIDFLKVNYIFPWIAKRAAKKRVPLGQSVHYHNSSTILILFTMRGNDSVKSMRWLQEQFERDNKKVVFLYMLFEEEFKPDVHLDEGMVKFEKNDLSIWGDVLNVKVKSILKDEFDYLIHTDFEPSVYSDLILSRNMAKCRMGKRFEGRELFYDFMIDTGFKNQVQYLLEQIYHYTKAI